MFVTEHRQGEKGAACLMMVYMSKMYLSLIVKVEKRCTPMWPNSLLNRYNQLLFCPTFQIVINFKVLPSQMFCYTFILLKYSVFNPQL